MQVARRAALLSTCFHAGFLFGLFFDPEDGGDIILRNVCKLSKGYRSYIPEDSALRERFYFQITVIRIHRYIDYWMLGDGRLLGCEAV
jgi:hypothetical protein